MDGFLIIDKPSGPSSQQVVFRIKKSLGLKKVGHTGTLDPLATGVLAVACGEATKVIAYLDESQKSYLVKGRLGIATDSYDVQGREVSTEDASHVTADSLAEVLQNFFGEQQQIPPAISAIKFKGRPLYQLARSGQEVPLTPRQVRFFVIELTAFQNPYFELRVCCSRGTYIRSLIHDVGQCLGVGAHVVELRRTQTGPFHLEAAHSLEKILLDPPLAKSALLSIEHCLSDLPRLNLESEREWQLVRSGVPLHRFKGYCLEPEPGDPKEVVLTYRDEVVAVATLRPEAGLCYRRVLNRG